VKPRKFNPNDCTSEKLCRLAKKCGFVLKEGGKHIKVLTPEGATTTIIPRGKLKRELAKGVIERLNQFGANIVYPKRITSRAPGETMFEGF
jgi:hypothetical protein